MQIARFHNRRLTFLICLFLLAGTGAVYWQVVDFDFINYDDPKYVAENPKVLQGLSWEGVRWAFTSKHASNWHPLTWLSLMLDRHLFGLKAGAFHLTNVVFHMANGVLLFIVLSRCTKAVWPSSFVALAFALHPVHVESVAWIAERKDVLSTLFWMLTMLAYVYYVRKASIIRYLLILVVFALGLMAKPMLVTLPCVLLLWDYWPLGRMNFTSCAADAIGQDAPSSVGSRRATLFLILEKIPFCVLSAASAVLTFVAQKWALVPTEGFGLRERVANALVSYLSYIAKMFCPRQLAIFYPHQGNQLPMWQIVAAVVLLFSISVLIVLYGRKKRYLIVGWLWYVGTLVPVIGLVQVGRQAMADRYTYVPLTGLFIIIAWFVYDAVVRWRYGRAVLVVLQVVLGVILMACSWRQIGYWRNSFTLFEHALNVTSNNYVAHDGLGVAFAEQGNIERAIGHFAAAVKINPNDVKAHFNLGKALAEQDRTEEAIRHYDAVLHFKPRDADTYNLLGTALVQQGKPAEAVAVYRRGLEFSPEHAHLHSNLGVVLVRQGQFDEAIKEFQAALELLANSKTCNNLGVAFAFKGEFDEAMKYYREAIRLEPHDAQAYYLLGNALFSRKRLDEAVVEYRKALQINPQHPKAGIALSEVLAEKAKSGRP